MSEEEYLDIVDENNNPIGKQELKSKAHKDGLWHKSAHVWILNSQNQLLLQKRAANKISHPNKWDISAAGHAKVGDDGIRTAQKEIEEEIGVKIKPGDLKFLFTDKHQSVQNNNTFFNNEFSDVYLLKKDLNIEDLTLQIEEVSEARWFDISDLKKEIENQNPNFVFHRTEYPKLFKYLENNIK